jgi:hypothetical protein
MDTGSICGSFPRENKREEKAADSRRVSVGEVRLYKKAK